VSRFKSLGNLARNVQRFIQWQRPQASCARQASDRHSENREWPADRSSMILESDREVV
jgi:hypothetical protein